MDTMADAQEFAPYLGCSKTFKSVARNLTLRLSHDIIVNDYGANVSPCMMPANIRNALVIPFLVRTLARVSL